MVYRRWLPIVRSIIVVTVTGPGIEITTTSNRYLFGFLGSYEREAARRKGGGWVTDRFLLSRVSPDLSNSSAITPVPWP